VTIQLAELLPLLDTISEQQKRISERLATLIEIFSGAPKPVEPALRTMLKPLREGMAEIDETLLSNSNPSI